MMDGWRRAERQPNEEGIRVSVIIIIVVAFPFSPLRCAQTTSAAAEGVHEARAEPRRRITVQPVAPCSFAVIFLPRYLNTFTSHPNDLAIEWHSHTHSVGFGSFDVIVSVVECSGLGPVTINAISTCVFFTFVFIIFIFTSTNSHFTISTFFSTRTVFARILSIDRGHHDAVLLVVQEQQRVLRRVLE